jgi:hypothetical protein
VQPAKRSRNKEDYRVVPPRNDHTLNAGALAKALGHQTVVIARNEAIFSCLLFVKIREIRGHFKIAAIAARLNQPLFSLIGVRNSTM